MSFLQILNEEDETSSTYVLRRSITSIGSDPNCDLRLEGADLTDLHATITCEGSQFSLRPSGRKTAVMVNGKKVRRQRVLEHGDKIELGGLQLNYCLLGQPPASDDDTSPTQQRRLEGLEQIHRLSLNLLRVDALDPLLEDLIDSAIQLSGADKGFLVLLDGDTWSLRVARNVDAETLVEQGRHLSDSVLSRVMQTREPLIVADARTDAQFSNAQSVIDLELCSVLCVPLLDRGELLGVLYLGNDRVTSQFDELDLDLLSIFAAQLSLLISNAILLDTLREDKRSLQQQVAQRRFGSLIGASDAMQPIFHNIERVAPTDITVLITGETGTGKELVAEEIHRRSPRCDGPFVTLNCGAIPENLLESELFGHEKGAFTGASAKKDGKFHVAHGGTILLDEMGEMPQALQVKLLRVLQQRTITRVGSNEEEPVDIRVLAATNRDLRQRVADGEFREDLFYRLNVVEIPLPPLRDRGEDIVLIARYLIDRICDQMQITPKKLSPHALQGIKKFDWPGNVRQLENRLKKALVLARGAAISPDDLDLPLDTLPEIQPLAEAKEEFALEYILKVLEHNDGNRSQTARDLDVDPRTIFRYLEKAPSSS